MKSAILLMIVLAAAPCSALQAQNLTGAWQGSLQGPQGPALRIVVKITRAPDESLKAALYSIDQGGTPINATSATQRGSTVKIARSLLSEETTRGSSVRTGIPLRECGLRGPHQHR